MPYYNTPEFDPIFVADEAEATEKIPHRVADFAFVNQRNESVTQSAVDGKIHVANFIFTSCGSICPRMINHMKIVDEAFKSDKDVVLLSYSVTPWIDSVGRLKAYAEANEIRSQNWHLLTGRRGEIYQLARRSYFAEEDLGFTKDSTEFLHTEHFLLVDKTRRIRGIYNGTLALEMHQLIKDIELLRREN